MRPPFLFIVVVLLAISTSVWCYSGDGELLGCVPLEPLPYGAECPGSIQDFLSAPDLQVPLNDAFHRYGLLIWRGQDLHPQEEVAFMKLLPHNESEPTYLQHGASALGYEKYNEFRIPGYKEILIQGDGIIEKPHFGMLGNISTFRSFIEWGADGVHESETPPVASSMYSVSVKPGGGDTLFMSGTGIYESVDPGLRDLLDGMSVQYMRKPKPMHKSGYRTLLSSEYSDEEHLSLLGTLYDDLIEEMPELKGKVHPLVWKHHPTGRRAVVVAPMWAHHVVDQDGVGWTEDETQILFENLLSRGIKTEYRHQWQTGDFLVWDNRQVLRSDAANNGFSSEGVCLLHRISLSGHLRPQSPLQSS